MPKRRLIYSFLRYFTAGLCSYEAGAIILDKDRFPTLSRLAGNHRWLAPTLLIALAVHLWWPMDKKVLYVDENAGTVSG